ncbi:MAG: SDR family oxidoreductase [Bacteroidetes bacterium]|nr:SDR family oxidoreductase [Bacteroidota bacterium]
MMNKTVVITGVARGLGAALAKRFGKEGAFIAGCDISEEDLSSFSKEMENLDIAHYTGICDVSDESSVKVFFDRLKESGRTTDILINNAGITNIKLFRDNTNEEIMRVMDINFRGCVYTTRAAYDDIIQNKGSFIAISSVAGFAPLIGRTAYAASKHAVLGFFESLRTEVKHMGAHVLVACPGFIDTKLRDHVYSGKEDNTSTKHKIGHNATPSEVADLIYLATVKREPMLVTGIGRISYWLKRLMPGVYEKLMSDKLKGGFDL